MLEGRIEFRQLPIHTDYGQVIHNVYYVLENNRSKVMDHFRQLSKSEQDLIKDLIIKMATVENFKSPKIKYNLRGYDYGEIRPMPHRFFFFQRYGNNIIFFDYIMKKKSSLKDEIYKRLERDKERYEKEFEKFVRRHR